VGDPAPRQQCQAVDGGGNHAEEEYEAGLHGPHPGGDHGQQFCVAEANAFAAAHQPVQAADEQDNDSCAGCPEERFSGGFPLQWGERAVSADERGVNDAEGESGKGEGVGKQHGFGVGCGETEQQPAENGGGDAAQCEPEGEEAEQEERCGGRLDERIADWRQRPRSSSSQLSRGMLSRFSIGVRQCGQRERGATTDSCRGRREMQTLRKLPKASPARTAKMEMSRDTLTASIWTTCEWRTRRARGIIAQRHRLE